MRFTHLIYLLFFFLLLHCKNSDVQLSKIEGKQIQVTDKLELDSEIDQYIAPYREHIQKDLDSVIAISPKTYDKTDGELNTALGNLMADIAYEQANPIFLKRTGHNIDMVLLNYGGIRSNLPKGAITKGTAFKLMPFENSLVVAAIKGNQVNDLVNYLVKARKAHPISKLQITIDKNNTLVASKINGTPIDPNKTYYVATNDYLYQGGDSMTFFQPNENLYTLDYKIRNTLIDYFMKVDSISPVRDNRFIKIN
ncbi:5'-nucleotidase C-terminal domain-containing protein [Tamlana sp. s12]|uniref:5'-nucleotidase C-terminal domain-containing protein n=1 Tax=Tamlana sp. s12 TaxID=1630406 RepID=UPI000801736B|nr:5'-nucleotidase [Tamlana sp. s12]OBQ56533.1 5'-nucleotidase [Tamlana sp. s12]QQY81834.1 5'-nucleotidase C-terminal domain-containing protein [Tamlana sp. s12]